MAAEVDGVDALEATYGARVGVWAVDTGTGQVLEHRAGERFAHASTLKLLLVALLLDRVTGAELDAVVPIAADDVLEYAPVTSLHVGTGLPLREVMAAAITVSDNTAANLLVDQLGGPAQVQTALRELGNATTRVDRVEPELNEAAPGDPRDTSTPADLGASVRELVLGDVLAPDRRALLQQWLQANTTGDTAIRAGVPAGWVVGDKTGSGGYGTRNDVAVVWPDDGGAPVVVVLLTDRGVAGADTDDGLLADATRWWWTTWSADPTRGRGPARSPGPQVDVSALQVGGAQDLGVQAHPAGVRGVPVLDDPGLHERCRVQAQQDVDEAGRRAELVLGEPCLGQPGRAGPGRLPDQVLDGPADPHRVVGQPGERGRRHGRQVGQRPGVVQSITARPPGRPVVARTPPAVPRRRP